MVLSKSIIISSVKMITIAISAASMPVSLALSLSLSKAFSFFFSALSLECFVCADCENKENERTSCSADHDMCIKRYTLVDDKKVTSKECGNKASCDIAKEVCEKLKEFSKDDKCDASCCDKDLCNTGALPFINTLLIAAGFLFSLIAGLRL